MAIRGGTKMSDFNNLYDLSCNIKIVRTEIEAISLDEAKALFIDDINDQLYKAINKTWFETEKVDIENIEIEVDDIVYSLEFKAMQAEFYKSNKGE